MGFLTPTAGAGRRRAEPDGGRRPTAGEGRRPTAGEGRRPAECRWRPQADGGRRPTAAEGRRQPKADGGRRPTRRIARTSCRKYLNTLRVARRGAARDLKSRLRAARARAPDYLNRDCGLRGVINGITPMNGKIGATSNPPAASCT